MKKSNTRPGKKRMRALKADSDRIHANDPVYKRAMNREFCRWLVIALMLTLTLRLFVFEPVLVEGGSMEPTLYNNERMLVEKVSLLFSPPKRGDIIICYYPGYVKSCVKRVIALPGETIEIREGKVYIDGEELDESEYWEGEIYSATEPTLIPEKHVFVMGDNRNASGDSRSSLVGPIPFYRIAGVVRAVVWPIDRMKGL